MEDELLSEDAEKALEELSKLYQKMPKERMTIPNMPRYAQAVESIKKIVA